MSKKYMFLIPLTIAMLMLCLQFNISFAQNGVSLPNPLGITDIFQLLDKIMGFLFLFSIPVAIIMLMYAGFLYITSAGNPKNIPNISKIIQYTLIGFIIVLMAKGIIYVVKDVLTNGATATPSVSNQGTYPTNNAAWKWTCNNNGSCTQDPNGHYDTQSQCQGSCQAIDGKYSCINSQCQAVNGGGQFSTLVECQFSCEQSGGQQLYKCDRSGSTPLCKQVSGSAWDPGISLSECQSSCK